MFAVIKTGGKQYKVAQDQVIVVEKLLGDAGAVVEFDDILAIGDESVHTVGSPRIDGAGVRGTVVAQTRDDKIVVFKKKRRKNYRRKQGHRQCVTTVRITEIVTEGFKKGAAEAKTEPQAKKAETPPPAAKKRPATSTKSAGKEPAVKKATAKRAAAKRTATTKAAVKKPAANSKSASEGTK